MKHQESTTIDNLKGFYVSVDILKHETLSSSAKLIYALLLHLDRCNSFKGVSISNPKLAKLLNISPRQIIIIINSLESEKLLNSVVIKELGNKRTIFTGQQLF